MSSSDKSSTANIADVWEKRMRDNQISGEPYSLPNKFRRNLTNLFTKKGFHDVEYLGVDHYSKSIIFAPKDNPDVVFKVGKLDLDSVREPMSSVTQPIGMWEVKDYKTAGTHAKIEILPRKSLEITSDGIIDYTRRSAEQETTLSHQELLSQNNIEQYNKADRAERSALTEQMKRNLGLVKKDSRLTEFAPQLEANRVNFENGKILPTLTPREQTLAERKAISSQAEETRLLIGKRGKIVSFFKGSPQDSIREAIAREMEHLKELREQRVNDLAAAKHRLKELGFKPESIKQTTQKIEETVTEATKTAEESWLKRIGKGAKSKEFLIPAAIVAVATGSWVAYSKNKQEQEAAQGSQHVG
ncbi:MAG: hypothetical protein R3D71_07320 [Rickettsiales bacterium]